MCRVGEIPPGTLLVVVVVGMHALIYGVGVR